MNQYLFWSDKESKAKENAFETKVKAKVETREKDVAQPKIEKLYRKEI